MRKIILTVTSLIIGLFIILYFASNSYLRGSVSSSSNGKTYLSILDDNGGKCGPIFVDDKIWEHPLKKKALISPGKHKIKCGTEIEFKIPKGVLFEFNYWGP